MNNKLWYAIRIVAGLAILAYLIYRLDIRKIYSTIIGIDFVVIILLLLHYATMMLLNSAAIAVLINASDEKIKFPKILKHYTISYAIGRFTPAHLGEFSLIYFLKKEKMKLGKAALITTLFRIISLIALVIISVFGLFYFFSQKNAIVIAAILVSATVLLCLAIFYPKIRNAAKKVILRNHAKKFHGFSESLNELIKTRKPSILASLIIVLFRTFIGAVIFYFAFLTFGVKVPILSILFIDAMGLIITLVPISVSGLGVKESATVWLFLHLGVAAAISGSIYLLATFMHFLFSAAILVARLFKRR